MTPDEERELLIGVLEQYVIHEALGELLGELMPAVDRIAAARSQQHAADAMEAMAVEMDGAVRLCSVPLWELAEKIRVRASTLRAGSGTP